MSTFLVAASLHSRRHLLVLRRDRECRTLRLLVPNQASHPATISRYSWLTKIRTWTKTVKVFCANRYTISHYFLVKERLPQLRSPRTLLRTFFFGRGLNYLTNPRKRQDSNLQPITSDGFQDRSTTNCPLFQFFFINMSNNAPLF